MTAPAVTATALGPGHNLRMVRRLPCRIYGNGLLNLQVSGCVQARMTGERLGYQAKEQLGLSGLAVPRRCNILRTRGDGQRHCDTSVRDPSRPTLSAAPIALATCVECEDNRRIRGEQ